MSGGLMTFEEYAKQARVTATYAHNGSNAMAGVMYAGLGLSDEFVEFLTALDIALDAYSAETTTDLFYEAGDVLWYVFNLCQDLDIDIKHIVLKRDGLYQQKYIYCLEPRFVKVTFTNQASIAIGSICGIIKKQYRDRDPKETKNLPIIMDTDSINRVKEHLNTIIYCVGSLLLQAGGFHCKTVVEVINKAMQLNIEKLTDRVNRGVLYGSGDHR